MNQALSPAAAGEDWAARYEQLRNDVLSQAAGGGFGLVLFLQQGMTGWIRISARTPVPAVTGRSTQPWDAVGPLPGEVRSQAAVILAGMLLHHSTEAILCKATCTS
ncbi:MAG: hypothetical protein WAN65_29890 [Candidatus Sulfotelmatobacter sp.]